MRQASLCEAACASASARIARSRGRSSGSRASRRWGIAPRTARHRALGIRPRGIYCTKDTFVTTALQAGTKIAWLENQTGVSYQTLRRHYGKWLPRDGESELHRFAALDPTLFRREEGDNLALRNTAVRSNSSKPLDHRAKKYARRGT